MKKYLTKGKIFGYSIWNTNLKPHYSSHDGIFLNEHHPYTFDEECYVSEDLIQVLFGKEFKLNDGEIVEISCDLIKQ